MTARPNAVPDSRTRHGHEAAQHDNKTGVNSSVKENVAAYYIQIYFKRC